MRSREDFIIIFIDFFIFYMFLEFSMNPLDQFEIRDLISLNTTLIENAQFSLTNIALYLILAGLVTFYLHIFTDNNSKLLSTK
jgi:F-type H+-transporting ATPase subunit a